MKTQQINFRLSETARNNLAVICEISGVNQTAAVEMALAALAHGLTTGVKMNTIRIEPEHLGESATIEQAEQMAKLLSERGYPASTTNGTERADTVPQDIWLECLEQIQ